jgi:hypothetical protein
MQLLADIILRVMQIKFFAEKNTITGSSIGVFLGCCQTLQAANK